MPLPQLHAFPEQTPPSPAFAALLSGVLTNPFHAKDGELIALGVPVSPTRAGLRFDVVHPLPEILTLRDGVVNSARDQDIGPSQHASIMRCLRLARQDVQVIGSAALAAEKLAELMTHDADRIGLHAWIFEGFSVATHWSHEQEIAVLVHSLPPQDEDGISALSSQVLELIDTAAVTNNLFRLSRQPKLR